MNVETKIKAAKYKIIWWKTCCLFRQDNKPANLTLKQHGAVYKGIALKWPNHNPELNPIKNLWQTSKTPVQSYSQCNVTELDVFAEKNVSIQKISVLKCVNHIDSRLEMMPKLPLLNLDWEW